MSRQRIVILANNIDEVGGAQRVVHVVAQGLAERGHEVELVGIAPFEPRHVFVDEPAYRSTVLMSEPWPAPSSDAQQARARLKSQAIGGLQRLLDSGPPGIAVTAQLWAMEFLAEVEHDGWPVIGQYHSSYEAAAHGRDLARVLALYSDVDAFTLLTQQDAFDFRRHGMNNTMWLPNPLAVWPQAPVRSQARTVTYLGRLSNEKGVRFLVEAWSLIAGAHPDWSLRLIGSGPEEKSLRKKVTALQKSGRDLRIEFVPPVTDVVAAYAEAGMVVLPSLTEGLPLVLAEAMACGLPCIATDCSAGVRLLARDGEAARLAARGDAGSLAREISALIDDGVERERLGERARAAMEPYQLSAVMDTWEKLLADVLR